MVGLQLYFLGTPHIKTSETIFDLPTRKCWALLVYVALLPQVHSRNALAALLWPDLDQIRARTALRVTLLRLNKVLGSDWAVIERETVQIQPMVWVDVNHFRKTDESLEGLETAVTLYTDDFLTGFSLSDSLAFDEWQTQQTELLRQELLTKLERAADRYMETNEFELALPHLRRTVAIDPLRESAHRRLMRLHMLSGQRADALRQYATISQMLADELGVAPTTETAELAEMIKNGRFSAPLLSAKTPAATVPPTRQHHKAVLISLLLVIAVLTTIGTWHNIENRQQLLRQTQARQLAAQARNYADEQLDLALLLSLYAVQLDGGMADTLFTLLDQLPAHFLTTLPHEAAAQRVAYHPNGRLLAIATSANQITLWDTETFQQMGTPVSAHARAITALVFSPDGRFLASASEDSSLILWQIQSEQLTRPQTVSHGSAIRALAFHPEGQLLAAGEVDGSITLWDVSQPDSPVVARPQLKGHSAAIASLAFNAGGTLLASGSWDKSILLWDTAEFTPIGTPLTGHTDFVNSIAFHPDGRWLASAGRDGTIRLWSSHTGQLQAAIPAHQNWIHHLTVSHDGQYMVSVGDGGEAFLWQTADLSTPPHNLQSDQQALLQAAFHPTSFQFTIANGTAHPTVWQADEAHLLHKTLSAHPNSVMGVVFDGQTLLSTDVANGWLRWQADVNRVEPVVMSEETAVQVWATNSDGWVATSDGFTIRLQQLADLGATTHLQPGPTESILSLALSPDSSMVASGHVNGDIILWDVASRVPLATLKGHGMVVNALVFSAPNLLFSGSRDGRVLMWHTVQVVVIDELIGGETAVNHLAISPDGTKLVAGLQNGAVKLWQQHNDAFTEAQEIGRHRGAVATLAFSDQEQLASGSWDGSILLFDLLYQVTISLKAHTRGITNLAFSPDGDHLASGSWDDTVILWQISPQIWHTISCRLAHRNLTRIEWQQFIGDETYQKVCLSYN